MITQAPKRRKAASGARQTAKDNLNHQLYRPRRRTSTPCVAFSDPNRAATAVDPSLQRGDAEMVTALGSLLIYLLGRDLPRQERETAWMLVARWGSELAEKRHHTGMEVVATCRGCR